MGFACFSAPEPVESPEAGKQRAEQAQQISRLQMELAAAKKHNKDLSDEVQGLQAERTRLLQVQEELLARPMPPPKADAATEMPMVTVAVMAKPPVEMESRIPRPTGEDAAPDAAPEPSPSKSPARSRIPSHPAAGEQAGAETAACNSPRAAGASQPQAGSFGPASSADLGTSELADPVAGGQQQQPQPQRPDLLAHQLKVAEAFKQSLEAQLRDARFANSNLQTQVLSLQTKLEKVVAQEVDELEKLNRQRKEGQEARDAAIKEAQQLRQQLAAALAAKQETQQQCDTTSKQLTELQQKLDATDAALEQATQELSACSEQLAKHGGDSANLLQELQDMQLRMKETEEQVQQLEAAAQEAADQHDKAITKEENELALQKALYDHTAAELLHLTTMHTKLKADFQALQQDTHNRDGVERLVLQEIQAQLSSRKRDASLVGGGGDDTTVVDAGTATEELDAADPVCSAAEPDSPEPPVGTCADLPNAHDPEAPADDDNAGRVSSSQVALE